MPVVRDAIGPPIRASGDLDDTACMTKSLTDHQNAWREDPGDQILHPGCHQCVPGVGAMGVVLGVDAGTVGVMTLIEKLITLAAVVAADPLTALVAEMNLDQQPLAIFPVKLGICASDVLTFRGYVV